MVGNPQAASRTRTVAELVATRVTSFSDDELEVEVIDLADLGPVLLEWGSEVVAAAKARVLGARALVVASPTYKAAYTGLLKLFLDQFEQGALGGAPTVAVMSGGSPHHSLAVTVHLSPVLVEIGASLPAPGLYVSGPEIDDPAPAVERWAERAEAPLRRALREPAGRQRGRPVS